MRRGAGLIVLLSSLSILWLPASPAAAQATTTTAFVMDSQTGDYIGQGLTRVFTPSNAQITATGSQSSVTMTADQGELDFDVRITPPQGQLLSTGTYQTARSADATHAGFDLTGDGRGCNRSGGTLTIHEIVAVAGLQAFAASYETHCEELPPALFGELRFNSSVGYKAASAPREASISAARRSVNATSIEVLSLGSQPVLFQQASIEGAASAEFAIDSDTCSRTSLPSGGRCSIQLTFNSDGQEPSEALLRIPDDTRRGNRMVTLLGTSSPVSPVPPGVPDTQLVPTVTKTRLLGHYGKRGKFQLFHVREAVIQIGWVIPPNAGSRLTFEIELKRGGWKRAAEEAFRIRKKGAAGAVFGGRPGIYRARNTFEGDSSHASSTSDWDYFKITP